MTDDITVHIRDSALAHLSEPDRITILRLMARSSEHGYRRGYQHGWYWGRNIPDGMRPAILKAIDLQVADWRFRGLGLDRSPSPPGVTKSHFLTTSLERLGMECPNFDRIGLNQHGDAAE
jgi:hypothetical protein